MDALEISGLVVNAVGALAFGIVMGWITYRTLRNSKVNGINDIAAVIGAVGGAAIVSLFPLGTIAFGAYSIGLALGFFSYLQTALRLTEKYGSKKAKQIEWLGEGPVNWSGENPDSEEQPNDAQ